MSFPEFFQFHTPTRIVYGPGISADLSAELADIGGAKAMMVTEEILGRFGIIDKVRSALEEAGLPVVACFDEVVPNSEVALVERGAEEARKAGVDRLIAVGGGSSLDTAKAINILLSEEGGLLDYQGAEVLTRPLSPLVAIPTTAGTGSEVTKVAVIADHASNTKVTFVDRNLTPSLAVLDPELTLSLPPSVTAATGMDALTHAIEAYVDIEASPMSDALAARAIRLISAHLIQAVEKGDDLEARAGMQIASTMAGLAFNHSMVGVVHGMAHALGGLCRIAHGEANAVMLPFGMEYNLEVRETKFADIARYLGVDTRSMSDRQAAEAAVEAVRTLLSRLRDSCGFPVKLSHGDVPRQRLQEVASLAMADGSMIYNPREVVEEEVLDMLERAH